MNKPVTIETENRTDHMNFLAGFTVAMLHTAQFKKITGALITEMLNSWAGTNRFKKGLIWPAVKLVSWMFKIKDSDKEKTPVKDFLDTADFGQVGAVLTSAVSAVNKLHQENHLYMSEKFGPAVRAILENTDFGELKEMMDTSADDVVAMVGKINEEVFEFPAKMVCIFSLVPTIVNILVRSLVKTTAPLNTLAPDMLTDVLISLLNELEGKNVGLLINELSEVIRKVHTGSALIGEKGTHALPAGITRFTAAMMNAVDIPLLLKSQAMLREIKGIIRASFIDILESHPEYAIDFFQSHFRSLVAIVKEWSLKADAFERLFTGEDISREFAKGMGELDAQEMASTVSRICALFNQVRQMSPGTIKNFLSQFFSAVDGSTAGETARWFMDDLVQSMKPLAPEIMPPVISGIADLIAPDGEISPEMKVACDKLRNAFNRMEVTA
jgi:hypothetical protein